MPSADGSPDARDLARGYMLGLNDTKVALRCGGGRADIASLRFGDRVRALARAISLAEKDYTTRHGADLDWDDACVTAAFLSGEVLVNVWCDEVEAAT